MKESSHCLFQLHCCFRCFFKQFLKAALSSSRMSDAILFQFQLLWQIPLQIRWRMRADYNLQLKRGKNFQVQTRKYENCTFQSVTNPIQSDDACVFLFGEERQKSSKSKLESTKIVLFRAWLIQSGDADQTSPRRLLKKGWQNCLSPTKYGTASWGPKNRCLEFLLVLDEHGVAK